VNSSDAKDYFLGLDCGTESVGWAVTDLEYNVLKFHNKYMWGSHLFSEAHTAQDRRVNRCARRRLERRKQRILWAQELFAKEIAKVDHDFFIRLKESAYLSDDKHYVQKNSLFNDVGFNDKDFFKKYPTIYHLRLALMNGTAEPDIRLVYLAVHHILKNRGHFLFTMGDDFSSVMDLSAVLDSFSSAFRSVFEGGDMNCSKVKDTEMALQKTKRSEKADLLNQAFTCHDDKLKKMVIKMMVGYKVAPATLFCNEDYKELPAVEFTKTSFEEIDLPILESGLSEDEFSFVLYTKSLFDWSMLARVLAGQTSLSAGKVNLFNENHKDLIVLKRALKKNCSKTDYHDFFHKDNKKNGNYSNYIGEINNNKKHKAVKRCSTELFYKRINSLIEKAPESDSDIKYIKDKIENGTFLNLLVSFRNGVVPYQVNLMELKLILKKASHCFPFLNEKDDSGLSVTEKLVDILKFRIPYYVGPLGFNSNNSTRNHWIERKWNEKITPWNFSDVVDEESSAEAFIKRMTNKCVYMPEEDVIPKNSLLYSKFMVLNEINNLKVNGLKITVVQKQGIYNDLFKGRDHVTQKQIITYMYAQGWYPKKQKLIISGIDGNPKSSLASYRVFKTYIDSKRLSWSDCEKIIYFITVFPEGGKVLHSRLNNEFGAKLAEDDISRIETLNFSGWGTMSEKFLAKLEGFSKETGEVRSIISTLWETNDNLMEILSSKYSFREELNNKPAIGKLSYEVVDDLFVSPSVKRQIWQTLKIVQEVHKVMGHAPKKVFIEVTRNSGKKKRTVSRKDDLLEKYHNLSKDDKQLILSLGGDNADKVKMSLEKQSQEIITKRDRLYLYYSQMGRCMYSGEPIDLENLGNATLYDIDHIFPYSKSGDDSLTNKVLVKSALNREKSQDYPIQDGIRSRMESFWSMLKKTNLINSEKYERLIRPTQLTDKDLEGFVNRQLVETSQSTKATAEILRRYYGDESKIVYSKASKVSDFRKEFEIWKCRAINNLHHAKDAYLNIVVGNIIDSKYSCFPLRSSFSAENNLSKPFDYDVPSASWKAHKNGTIQTVYSFVTNEKMEKTILCTVQPITGKGPLFDLQIRNDKEEMLPVKSSDPILAGRLEKTKDEKAELQAWTKQYGGYNSLSTSHFALVKSFEKSKPCVSIIPISIVDKDKYSTDGALLDYCRIELKLINPEVIRLKVHINALFRINKYPLRIKGKSNGGKVITMDSGLPLILANADVYKYKKVEKVLEKLANDKSYIITEEYDCISKESNEKLFSELMKRLECNIYKQRLGNQTKILRDKSAIFDKLSIENQCRLLYSIVQYFGMGNGQCDLSLIEGSKQAGTITCGAKIMILEKSVEIVDQSVTGLFEKVHRMV